MRHVYVAVILTKMGQALMKRLLLLSALYCPACLAQDSAKEALRHLERAVMRVPLVRTSLKAAEQHVLSKLSLEKDHLKYLAPLLLLNARTLDSGKLAPVKIQLFQGELRPAIRYNMDSKDFNTMVIYTSNF